MNPHLLGTDRVSDIGVQEIWWQHGPSLINSLDPHLNWQPITHRATRTVYDEAVMLRCNECARWEWMARLGWSTADWQRQQEARR